MCFVHCKSGGRYDLSRRGGEVAKQVIAAAKPTAAEKIGHHHDMTSKEESECEI